MSEPTAFPLAWPAHKPRTGWSRRKSGQFKKDDRPISREQAIKRVQHEVSLLGGGYLIVSSDVPIRRDGMPYSNRSHEPMDPGVCVYFRMAGKPYAMACDTFDNLAQNIAAVAGHMEATRKIERYGVATAAETLQAFTALPAPTAPAGPPWWEVLGIIPERATPAAVSAIYREEAKRVGDDQDKLRELNLARDAAMKALAE